MSFAIGCRRCESPASRRISRAPSSTASSGSSVPGTELTPERRAVLVRNLTIAGWLLLGGSIGFIAFQLERVRIVTEQPFAGVWDQRIEVLSFLMLPSNLVVLAPATFVAAIATWLAGAEREPWLNTLLRFGRRHRHHTRSDRARVDRHHRGQQRRWTHRCRRSVPATRRHGDGGRTRNDLPHRRPVRHVNRFDRCGLRHPRRQVERSRCVRHIVNVTRW